MFPLPASMKFEIRHPDLLPVTLSWNEEMDIISTRSELFVQLQTLKKLVDGEFDSDPDFSEVRWVDDRIAALRDCMNINPNSPEAQNLIQEFYQLSAVQEELDRLSDPETGPIVQHIAWLAGRCLRKET